jgi:putative ABC transport system substrate-binding protein
LDHRRVAASVLVVALLTLVETLPCPASAEHNRPRYRVGVLNDASAANHPTVDGLKAGLRELGFTEGRDIIFDVRLVEGTPERMPAAAGALLRAGVDLIFTSGEAATLAARTVTRTIPIVFTLVGNPVAAGIASSPNQLPGNLTGISSLTAELVPKRLEALKALAPNVRRVWAIHHGTDPGSGSVLQSAIEFSPRFGIEVVPQAVLTPAQLEQAVARVRPGDALLVLDTAAMNIAAVLLETSLVRRVPAVFPSELWVNHGGLVSYGADYRGQGVQAARLVAKILRGTSPRDIPVEAAERIVLAVNLKTAASFGLTVPRTVLFRADLIRR